MERHLTMDCLRHDWPVPEVQRNTKVRKTQMRETPIRLNSMRCEFFCVFLESTTDYLTPPSSFTEMPSEVLSGTSFPEVTQLLLDHIDCVAFLPQAPQANQALGFP